MFDKVAPVGPSLPKRDNPYAGPNERALERVTRVRLIDLYDTEYEWHRGGKNLHDVETALRRQKTRIGEAYRGAGDDAVRAYQQVEDLVGARRRKMNQVEGGLKIAYDAFSTADMEYRTLPVVRPPSTKSPTRSDYGKTKKERKEFREDLKAANEQDAQHEQDKAAAEKEAGRALNELDQRLALAVRKMRPVAAEGENGTVSTGATTASFNNQVPGGVGGPGPGSDGSDGPKRPGPGDPGPGPGPDDGSEPPGPYEPGPGPDDGPELPGPPYEPGPGPDDGPETPGPIDPPPGTGPLPGPGDGGGLSGISNPGGPGGVSAGGLPGGAVPTGSAPAPSTSSLNLGSVLGSPSSLSATAVAGLTGGAAKASTAGSMVPGAAAGRPAMMGGRTAGGRGGGRMVPGRAAGGRGGRAMGGRGAGKSRKKDRRKSGQDLWDDGEDWLGDEDVGPQTLR